MHLNHKRLVGGKMTTVTINEEWRVNIDEFNHTLERYSKGGNLIPNGRYKDQLSKPSWNIEGYYPNLNQCLKRVRTILASEGTDVDLNGYIARLERLELEIKL